MIVLRTVRALVLALVATVAAWWIAVAVSEWRDPSPVLIAGAVVYGALVWAIGLPLARWSIAAWALGFAGPFGSAVAALGAGALIYRRPVRSRRWIAGAALGAVALVGVGGAGQDPHRIGAASIACLGDSSTAGMWVARPYCAILGGTNAAIPGSSIDEPDGLLAQLQSVADTRPAVVLVMAGGNYQRGAPSPAEYRRALTEVDLLAHTWGGRSVLVEYPVRVPLVTVRPHAALVGAPPGVPVVHPRLPWWEISGDHIHPTAAGHRRIAHAIVDSGVLPD